MTTRKKLQRVDELLEGRIVQLEKARGDLYINTGRNTFQINNPHKFNVGDRVEADVTKDDYSNVADRQREAVGVL